MAGKNERQSTFHEQWYLVENLTPRLRPELIVRRQTYWGTPWYIISDPDNNVHFRLARAAYAFVALLDGKRTVREAWEKSRDQAEEYLAEHYGPPLPAGASRSGGTAVLPIEEGTELLWEPEQDEGADDGMLTQGEVIALLGRMHSSNLLLLDMPADTENMLRRRQKRHLRKVGNVLSSFLFLRIPLFTPDAFFSRFQQIGSLIFRPAGMALWVLMLLLALRALMLNWDLFVQEARQTLNPDNILWLYAVIVLSKIVHECGHAFACKYYCAKDGLPGDVSTLGIMLLFFAPLPYIDVSSSVQIRSRFSRAMVGLAGVYTELFLAFVSLLVWASTTEGTAPHLLCRNVVIITSVSTLIFNINPLLRFDGYFVFSDLLNLPNLYQRSQAYVIYLFKRFILGVRKASTVVSKRSEKIIYPVYAVAAFLYRIVITVSIFFLLEEKLATLGIVLTICLALLWFVIPACKGAVYLVSGPELAGRRALSNFRFALLAASIAFLLLGLPADSSIIVEGAAESRAQQLIFAEVEGTLTDFADTDTTVRQGESVLATIDNPGLKADLVRLTLDVRVARAKFELEKDKGNTDAAGMAALQVQSAMQQLEIVSAQVARSAIRSPGDGLWVAPELTRRRGKWISQGDMLGVVFAPENIRLRTVVDQFDAARLFAEPLTRIEFALSGRPDLRSADNAAFTATAEGAPTPAGRRELFHPSLGQHAGGQSPVTQTAQGNIITLSHFFELRLLPDPQAAHLLHPGQRVQVKLVFGEQPLGLQWLRRLRQFFTRY